MVEVCLLEESLKWCLKAVKTYDLKRLCGKRYRPFRRQASGVNLLVFAIGQEFILQDREVLFAVCNFAEQGSPALAMGL